MVNIGIAGIPRMFPGQKQTIVNGSNVQTGVLPLIETDVVGQGYPDATPIVVPPGSASGAVVNTTPKMYQGILPRHNTPSGPSELGGKVIMNLTSGVYIPKVQFTPPEVEP
jgi:hypothetical protein